MSYTRSGVTATCGICEATNVPVRWDNVLYRHECTVPWDAAANRRYPAELKCPGESGDQVFARMLRNAGLAMCGDNKRLATDEEIAAPYRQAREAQKRARAEKVSN